MKDPQGWATCTGEYTWMCIHRHLIKKMYQLSRSYNYKRHWEWGFFLQDYNTRLALRHWDLVWKLKWSCTGCDVEGEFVLLKPPWTPAWLSPKPPPPLTRWEVRCQRSPRLIVMIMSLRLQGAGWGLSAGENVFRGWNWWRERRRGGESGLVQQECHVIFPVIPRPLLWKQCTRSECTIPVALATSQTNKQAWHPTNHPLPTPTLGPHGYLSWLGWVYLEAN